MDIVGAFVLYFSGIVTGVIGMTILILHLGKKGLAAAKKVDKATVSDRLKRVKEITLEQFDLNADVDGPLRNGLDAKYKNRIIDQMKLLEEEKTKLLLSILNDGHDPEVTVSDGSGEVTTLKLSEFMAKEGIVDNTPKKEPKAKQLGKFTVHKGGKDDSGNDTIH